MKVEEIEKMSHLIVSVTPSLPVFWPFRFVFLPYAILF